MKTTFSLNLIGAAIAVFAGFAYANLEVFHLGSSGRSVGFFFDPVQGGNLTCNGEIVQKPPGGPAMCGFDNQRRLEVRLASWSGATALLSEGGEITGPCRGSPYPVPRITTT
jgi:hypothetical protein